MSKKHKEKEIPEAVLKTASESEEKAREIVTAILDICDEPKVAMGASVIAVGYIAALLFKDSDTMEEILKGSPPVMIHFANLFRKFSEEKAKDAAA